MVDQENLDPHEPKHEVPGLDLGLRVEGLVKSLAWQLAGLLVKGRG